MIKSSEAERNTEKLSSAGPGGEAKSSEAELPPSRRRTPPSRHTSLVPAIQSFVSRCGPGDLVEIQKAIDRRLQETNRSLDQIRIRSRVSKRGFCIGASDLSVYGLSRIRLWLNVVVEADVHDVDNPTARCVGPSKKQPRWFRDLGGSVKAGDADFNAESADVDDIVCLGLESDWTGAPWSMRCSSKTYLPITLYFAPVDTAGLPPGEYSILRDFSTGCEPMTVSENGTLTFANSRCTGWRTWTNGRSEAVQPEQCGPLHIASFYG